MCRIGPPLESKKIAKSILPHLPGPLSDWNFAQNLTIRDFVRGPTVKPSGHILPFFSTSAWKPRASWEENIDNDDDGKGDARNFSEISKELRYLRHS